MKRAIDRLEPFQRAIAKAHLASAGVSIDSLESKPLIAIAMGQMGIVTRIAGESFGSDITFGTVGEQSAPGQIHVNDLKLILETLHKYS